MPPPPDPEVHNPSDDPVNGDVDLSLLGLIPDDDPDAEWRAEMEASEMIVQGTPAAIEFTRCIYRLLSLPLNLFVLQQPVKLWPYLDDFGRPDGYHFMCGRNVNGLLCHRDKTLIVVPPGGGLIDPAMYRRHYSVVLEHLKRLSVTA